jgi:hypothetical protein
LNPVLQVMTENTKDTDYYYYYVPCTDVLVAGNWKCIYEYELSMNSPNSSFPGLIYGMINKGHPMETRAKLQVTF